jgi:predicted outer membrane repeat protein
VAVDGIGTVAEFNGSIFESNTAAGVAGAALLSGSRTTFTECTFRGNTAQDSKKGGGAVYVGGSDTVAEFNGSTFESNTAAGRGGAAWLTGGHTTFNRCLFSTNVASFSGGAIAVTLPSLSALSSLCSDLLVGTQRFVDNRAEFAGGALYFDTGSSLRTSTSVSRQQLQCFAASSFQDNAAGFYGNDFASNPQRLSIQTAPSLVSPDIDFQLQVFALDFVGSVCTTLTAGTQAMALSVAANRSSLSEREWELTMPASKSPGWSDCHNCDGRPRWSTPCPFNCRFSWRASASHPHTSVTLCALVTLTSWVVPACSTCPWCSPSSPRRSPRRKLKCVFLLLLLLLSIALTFM